MSPAAIGYRNGNFEISGLAPLSADGGNLFDVVGELDDGYDQVDDCDNRIRREIIELVTSGSLMEFRGIELAILWRLSSANVVAQWNRAGWMRPIRRTGMGDVYTMAEVCSFLEQYPRAVTLEDLPAPFDRVYQRAHGNTRWLSTTEWSHLKGIPDRTVQKACREGRLPHRFVGRRHLLIPADVDLPGYIARPHLRKRR